MAERRTSLAGFRGVQSLVEQSRAKAAESSGLAQISDTKAPPRAASPAKQKEKPRLPSKEEQKKMSDDQLAQALAAFYGYGQEIPKEIQARADEDARIARANYLAEQKRSNKK